MISLGVEKLKRVLSVRSTSVILRGAMVAGRKVFLHIMKRSLVSSMFPPTFASSTLRTDFAV